MQKLGNSAKSTNNPMSSFGLFAEKMELTSIYETVKTERQQNQKLFEIVIMQDDISFRLSIFSIHRPQVKF